MLEYIIFLGLFFIILASGFFLTVADSDITLLWLCKFGKPISALKNNVIWITGASSGIGEFLSYELAAVGAKLALSGRNVERLEKVKKQCVLSGKLDDKDILLVPFDITDFSLHSECVQKVINHFGKIDILVNNAGRTQRAMFVDIELEVDRQMFELNVLSSVSLSRIVLRHFIEQGAGHFVITSSGAGKFGAPNSASYTASKHALHGYFESLRTEMSNSNISVTIVCPGPVFTPLLEIAFTGKKGEVVGQKHSPQDKRMAVSRCAYLMGVAIANKVDEVWLCLQPILTVYYISQYTPSFFRQVIVKKVLNPGRVSKMRDGR
ncbi:dehydrogenase/reductase SDR family member 7-like [Limulus polyphemus]|uniref:Dehydrogenase/reductase SDR family member 7-like n=1 Tax=Limulus polyphemus TaxID=6850 RepID=A0ABM1B911_LIMPO|nr:dehydrogenase/reductase SDR family member 7-like [Limulus polyphemus]